MSDESGEIFIELVDTILQFRQNIYMHEAYGSQNQSITLFENVLSHLNFSDPDRFTWLLATLAFCSLGAGILSLLMPKGVAQNVDPSKIKSEDREGKEMAVEINQAYEGDLQANMDTRSV